MERLMIGIYRFKNIINNKCYVGSSANINKRFNQHINDLTKNKHHSIVFQRAWNKYGKDSFVFDVITECAKHDLLFYEQLFIDNLQPEYNICKLVGSSQRLGLKHSLETKKKMSEQRKGRKLTKEWRDNIVKSLIGRKHSEETKVKISNSQKGEKNHAFGKKLSNERKQEISKDSLGRKHSEETKTKLAEKRKGENNPMFGRKGIDAPNFGKKRSEATIEKARKALTKFDKKTIINEYNGRNSKELSEKYGCSKRSVYQWYSDYKRGILKF